MSRNQVRFLLGTPAIADLYHPDQWHYVFYLKTGDDGKIEKRIMTLNFQGDLLGKKLAVEFIAHLRDIARFDSAEALVAQIREDERQARQILESLNDDR